MSHDETIITGICFFFSDEFGRRRTKVLAVDASDFSRDGSRQYTRASILRELRKFYSGVFCDIIETEEELEVSAVRKGQ